MQTSFKIKGRKPKINDFRKKFNRKGPGPWARGCGPKGFNAVLKGPNGPGGSDSYDGSSNHFRSNFESCSKQLRIISEVTSNHCRNNFESFLKHPRSHSLLRSHHQRLGAKHTASFQIPTHPRTHYIRQPNIVAIRYSPRRRPESRKSGFGGQGSKINDF